jgi:tetratricopeptide (TPR) repeat protein
VGWQYGIFDPPARPVTSIARFPVSPQRPFRHGRRSFTVRAENLPTETYEKFADTDYHLPMTESDSPVPSGPAPRIWGDIPQRNKNFTGRDAILTLLRRSIASRVTAVVPEDPLPQALQGLGGVGKTAVAIEYAHRYRGEYDVVWWIPADQLPLVRASLAALALRLGLTDSTATTGIEGAAKAALDALRRGQPYSRWLLIFDNADQPEDFPDFIPQGAGDVLITSRNHRWGGRAETVQMNVFSRTESVEFLRKRAPIEITDREADLLAEKLGDLPLALEQAGAMLAETGMPVEEYLKLIEEQIVKIMAEGKSAEYGTSVTAAWAVSVAKVRQQLPEAEELLRSCAFFGPEPIPRDVFRRGTGATSARISELMQDSILFAQAIRELGRFALVTIGGRSISVHRLVQALLRGELSASEQSRYRHDIHLILAAAAPPSPADDRYWRRYRELLPHVTAEATEFADCTVTEVRALALDVMRYLYLIGDHPSCVDMSSRFINQWTMDSGPDDPSVIDANRHYGNVLRGIGRNTEALAINEQNLDRARAVLGPGDAITLAIQTSVAADQRARGNFTAARDIDSEALDLSRAALGQDDPQTMRTISNLAIDYGLTSDYRRSQELSQLAHQLTSEATTGASPNDVLISWYQMAWALRLQGKHQAARDVAEDALDYGRERLGADHPATLRTATGLSVALRRIAATRESAVELARDTYELARSRHGEGHPDTMAAAMGLSNSLRTVGQFQEALALADRAAATFAEIYGADHPYNYACQGNLAVMHRVTEQPEDARRLDEGALAGLTRRLGLQHDYTLLVAINLASDLALLGEREEAIKLGRDTRRRLIDLLGSNDQLTLACSANLALDLHAEGALAESAQLHADTMSRYADALGPSHPDTVVATGGGRLDFDFDPVPL